MSTRLPLTEHFAALDDPRVERTKLHLLLSIVVIAICTVITGAKSWDDIEEFKLLIATPRAANFTGVTPANDCALVSGRSFIRVTGLWEQPREGPQHGDRSGDRGTTSTWTRFRLEILREQDSVLGDPSATPPASSGRP